MTFELTASPALPVTTRRTVQRALSLLEKHLREPGALFTSTAAVRDWLRLKMTGLEREVFMVLFLDNQHRLLECETLFSGTINSTEVHPREVVKAGLRHNAATAVLAHNHPSGHSEPSDADRRITERLKQALDLVDIRLLDHLVVGRMDIVSFAERGWL
ncbi:RadC family protein [Klebsiella pneumoniae]|uniref:RadC family protein n=1 Tax=Klebsiella pneumoniae TaxID=573 RepID=UPI001083D379|nr:DNA repair protein RadC [Klebsiella pneumoniae]MDD1906321.1 DNA repair protein RadC [Klebsiella pneumoniae]MDD1911615.1 DNA repair protein RadC [Klebsiella pneumoniae]MDP0740028.1 DNA repair protein RadC [Klebsiella pneumoniae]VGD66212.1 DNA repair protein RadC [Klebsiella pneumoniae]HBR5009470.1 DNA repair protein RadC [Klebsiella pneumoniae]